MKFTGSVGIKDPCAKFTLGIHFGMTLEEQDQVCMTAQNLLRVWYHGGFEHVLGTKGNSSSNFVIATKKSIWNGVFVSPNEKVYTKPEKKDGDTEMKVVKTEKEIYDFSTSMM